ncbi:hypothetical protein [Microbulbifer sp. MCCC 1A16149]|uniref:hypothetical protein n=1 Tax=Microbulbifer sp. MCCC 1A16149 TaxID=3411322 RepID=UPI003D0F4058
MNPQQKLQMQQQYAVATARAHAEIRNEIADRMRYGEPVPRELYSKLQSLETEAQSLLPLEGLQAALKISNHYAAQFDQQSQQRYEAETGRIMRNAVERGAQKLTAGMYGEKGLSPEQFNQLKNGEKLKIQNPKKSKFSTASFEAIITDNGKKNLKQQISKLDDLHDKKRMRDPAQYQEALRSAGVSKELAEYYDRYAIDYGMAKRQEEAVKNEADFEEVEAHDDYQRKAQIADNWMERNDEIPVTEEINSDYLNHVEYDKDGNEQPSLTQSIARAMEYHDNEVLNNE